MHSWKHIVAGYFCHSVSWLARKCPVLSLSPATVIYCLHTWNQVDDELKSTVPLLELYIRYIRYLITATQKQYTHWYFLLSLSCISALGCEGEYKYKEDNLSKLSGHHSSFDSQRSSVTRKRSPLARKNFIVFGGSTNECGMNNGKLFWLPGFVSGENDPYLHWRSYKVKSCALIQWAVLPLLPPGNSNPWY